MTESTLHMRKDHLNGRSSAGRSARCHPCPVLMYGVTGTLQMPLCEQQILFRSVTWPYMVTRTGAGRYE